MLLDCKQAEMEEVSFFMSVIGHVLGKKFRRLGPVMVEGKFFKRIGNCFKQFFTWLDRKIGYGCRCILWNSTKTKSNQVMFFPFSHSVGCNLKYISDELIRRNADVEIYWSVMNPLTTRLDAAEIVAKEYEVTDKVLRLSGGHKVAGLRLEEWKKKLKQEEKAEKDGQKKQSEVGAPSHEEILAAEKIRKTEHFIEKHVHFVKTNTYEYFEAAAASKVLFTNSLLGDKFYPFPVRKDQLVVQTWHGSLGIKRFDPAHYNTNVTWPIAAERTGKLTTQIISNSAFEDGVFRETFWKETPILKYGHARNDIFFAQSENVRKYLKQRFCAAYGLPADTHFALYAPTFRDDHNFAVYDLNAEQTLRALKQRFGGEWKLLLRYHDNDKKNEAKKNTVQSENVIDVTQYPDMQSLLAFTDCGITDYSSWIYDYVLLRKPGFLFAMDRAKYDNERGFYFRLEDTPFPVSTDSDELEETILSFDEERFQQRVTEFLADKGCMDDGNASVRIADQVVEWINGNS